MTDFNKNTSSKLSRYVVALGRKYSKTAFPNPDRDRCPNRTTLRAMAERRRNLTLEDIPASHVVNCSPCFQEYLRLRRMSLLFRGARITVAAVAVAALVFLSLRIVQNRTSPTDATNTLKKQSRPNPPNKGKETPAPSTPSAMRIDLALFSPTRGDGSPNEKSIPFPHKALRISLLLPVGMEPGEYEIRLQDSTGSVVTDQHVPARLKDGITSMELHVNLTDAAPGSYTLMIRPPGLSWRSYPAVVE